ncbi:MAG TPA: division/cell wall cluster transcriptional repressor MraZ [Candidatus Dormibacteraeota bacterium]
MFVGTFRNRVDEKGRVAIPPGFRRQLNEGSHLSIGPDNVLTIYPADQWAALVEQLNNPFPSREQRALARALFSMAIPCEFDGQGRLTLSQEQRRQAAIEPRSTVSVVGAGSRVEIWAEPSWEPYSDDVRGRFTDLVDQVIQRP